MVQKIQLVKVSKTEGVSKENSLKKNERKDVQKTKMIDTLCENNINTVAEELVSLENVGTIE